MQNSMGGLWGVDLPHAHGRASSAPRYRELFSTSRANDGTTL